MVWLCYGDMWVRVDEYVDGWMCSFVHITACVSVGQRSNKAFKSPRTEARSSCELANVCSRNHTWASEPSLQPFFTEYF